MLPTKTSTFRAFAALYARQPISEISACTFCSIAALYIAPGLLGAILQQPKFK